MLIHYCFRLKTRFASHKQECAQDGSPRHLVSWRTVLKRNQNQGYPSRCKVWHQDTFQDATLYFQDTLSRHTIKTPFKTDAKKFTRHRQDSKYVFKTLCKIFKTLTKASWKSIKCLDAVSWKYVRCLESQKVCILKTLFDVLKVYLDRQLTRLEECTTIRLEKILKRLEKSFFFQDTFQDTLQDSSIKTLLMTSWRTVLIYIPSVLKCILIISMRLDEYSRILIWRLDSDLNVLTWRLDIDLNVLNWRLDRDLNVLTWRLDRDSNVLKWRLDNDLSILMSI